jgi:hypothetical protein
VNPNVSRPGGIRGFYSQQFTDEDYKARIKAKCLFDPFLGCWLYKGSRAKNGYTEISYRSSKWGGHRLAYFLWKGPIPKGQEVRHKCDIRHCCNPEHLELGSHHDNLIDCLERGRHGQKLKTHCKHGHEFTPENTRVYRGARTCLTCERSRGNTRTGLGRRLKTVCKHGHPLSGDNLYITSEGRRRCRACHHRHVKEHKERFDKQSTSSEPTTDR